MDGRRRPGSAAGRVRRGRGDAVRSAACGQRPWLDRRPGPVSGSGDPAGPARLALARRRGRGLAAVLDLPRADSRPVLTAAGWTTRSAFGPRGVRLSARTAPGSTGTVAVITDNLFSHS